MSAARRDFFLPDGERLIRVREWGDPEGPLIVSHHGTPSSSAAVPGGWRGADGAGVRVVSFDRPGYGSSERQPGRRVSDAARWSAIIADALGVDRFSVIGTSGGGPHAAAAAALLPDRVERLVIDVGLGPVPLTGFDPRAEMVDETAREIDAARIGEDELRAFIAHVGGSGSSVEAWLHQLPAADREVIARPDVVAEEAVEAAELQEQDVDGWVDDELAMFGAPWGFDPREIRVPTLLAYGADDVLVPLGHGRAWQRAVSGAELVVIAGAGHWLRDSEPMLLDWLAGRVDPRAVR